MKKLLIVLVLLGVIATIASAVQVSKQEWIKGMATALPAAFCRDGQYFRECFSVSQEECEKIAMSATRVCLEQHKEEIPEQLNQPKDGTHWGTVVGKCVGNTYETVLVKEKINTEKCNTAENGM